MIYLLALVVLLGYVLIGIAAFSAWLQLSERYPFGVPGSGFFWWTKYLPILGYGLLLMATGESFMLKLPGIGLIISSFFFLPAQKTK